MLCGEFISENKVFDSFKPNTRKFSYPIRLAELFDLKVSFILSSLNFLYKKKSIFKKLYTWNPVVCFKYCQWCCCCCSIVHAHVPLHVKFLFFFFFPVFVFAAFSPRFLHWCQERRRRGCRRNKTKGKKKGRRKRRKPKEKWKNKNFHQNVCIHKTEKLLRRNDERKGRVRIYYYLRKTDGFVVHIYSLKKEKEDFRKLSIQLCSVRFCLVLVLVLLHVLCPVEEKNWMTTHWICPLSVPVSVLLPGHIQGIWKGWKGIFYLHDKQLGNRNW